MKYLKEFIEKFRQTGNTTILVQVVKNYNAYLVVSNQSAKQCIIQNLQCKDIAHRILTLNDIETGKHIGLNNKSTVFFDNSAIQALINNFKVENEPLHDITVVKVKGNPPTMQELEQWRDVFQYAETNPDFKIIVHPDIEISKVNLTLNDSESEKHNHQLNIKLTENDTKEMNDVNNSFFEGEISNSMLGRILLRKGIAFYKKLKSSF